MTLYITRSSINKKVKMTSHVRGDGILRDFQFTDYLKYQTEEVDKKRP